MYLLLGKLAREKGTRVVVGHVNYGTRGKDSLKDQVLVENIGKELGCKTLFMLRIAENLRAAVRESGGGSRPDSRRRLGRSGSGF